MSTLQSRKAFCKLKGKDIYSRSSRLCTGSSPSLSDAIMRAHAARMRMLARMLESWCSRRRTSIRQTPKNIRNIFDLITRRSERL